MTNLTNPWYWLDEDTTLFLERSSLAEGETPQQRVSVIAKHCAKLFEQSLKEPSDSTWLAERVYYHLMHGHFSLSSPIWANYGNKEGLPVSCFGSYVEDNTPSILNNVSEVGIMSKFGGGCSGYLGDIRPRGSKFGTNGKTFGVTHFLKLFESVSQVISQGSVRRGHFSPYLPVEHGDFEEFVSIGTDSSPIQGVNHGVTLSDEFMQKVEDKDPDALQKWLKILETRTDIGYPYMMYKGNANNNTVPYYKDDEILASNMCIAGADRVVTSEGYLTAEELYERDEELTLFNGEMPVKASKMKLREKDADTYKITLHNGMEHTITSYHGIPVVKGARKDKIVRTECKDLRIGDQVPVQINKGLFGNKKMEKEAFLLGLYQSDGTQYKDTIMLDVWENDFDILEEVQEAFNEVHHKYGCDSYEVKNQHGDTSYTRTRKPATFHECQVTNGDVRKKRISSKTLSKALNFQKGFVPDWIWESNERTQWQYVRGLMVADGTVYMHQTSPSKPIQISYADINKDFLKDLQLLMNNLGVKSSIHMLREGGKTLLPDGKGGQDYYDCKDCYRLIITNKTNALVINEHTGFLDRKGIDLEDKEYRDNSKRYSEIVSIEYAGKQDVYCPTVYNDEHIFVSQGMKTFNCSEIMLPQTPTESFVCVLASMNLATYDSWKDTDAVDVLTILLDTVVTEFLNKVRDMRYDIFSTHEEKEAGRILERAYNFAERHRAIGIGQLGWHTLLKDKGIPFESRDAAKLNVEISELIQARSNATSISLGRWSGVPEKIKSNPDLLQRRNTTLTAIAPTKSSSFILGKTSQGIEPEESNYYIREAAKHKVPMKDKALIKVLQKYGKDTRETWDSIAQHEGSVQHLDFLSDHEKAVFKTFFEISPMAIINQAAARQSYVDQGQSINLAINSEAPVKEIHELYLAAWKMGIKSLYYQKGTNYAQQLSKKLTDCDACQA